MPPTTAVTKKLTSSPSKGVATTKTPKPSETTKKSAKKSVVKKAGAFVDLTKERYSMSAVPKHNLSFCGFPKKVKPVLEEGVDALGGSAEPTSTTPYSTSSVVLRAIAEGYCPPGMEEYVASVKAAESARAIPPVVADAATIQEKPTLVSKKQAPKKVRTAPKKAAKKSTAAGANNAIRSGALRVYGQLAHAFVDAKKCEREGAANLSEDATAALTHLGVAHMHCFGGTGETGPKKNPGSPSGPQPSFKKSYGYFFAAGSPKASETPTEQTLLSRYYMAIQQIRGQGTEKSIYAAQEGFNFVIANEAINKPLVAASLYQLGRLYETGRFVDVTPREVDVESPKKVQKTQASPRPPSKTPLITTANATDDRVAGTMQTRDEKGAFTSIPIWFVTPSPSESSALLMFSEAAKRGSEDAQRRAELITELQAAKKRKDEDLAKRKSDRLRSH